MKNRLQKTIVLPLTFLLCICIGNAQSYSEISENLEEINEITVADDGIIYGLSYEFNPNFPGVLKTTIYRGDLNVNSLTFESIKEITGPIQSFVYHDGNLIFDTNDGVNKWNMQTDEIAILPNENENLSSSPLFIEGDFLYIYRTTRFTQESGIYKKDLREDFTSEPEFVASIGNGVLAKAVYHNNTIYYSQTGLGPGCDVGCETIIYKIDMNANNPSFSPFIQTNYPFFNLGVIGDDLYNINSNTNKLQKYDLTQNSPIGEDVLEFFEGDLYALNGFEVWNDKLYASYFNIDVNYAIYEFDLGEPLSVNNTFTTKEQLKVYPIPMNDHVNLSFKGIENAKSFKLISLLGTTVYEQAYNNEDTVKLTPNNIASGVYFLQVNFKNQLEPKLVKLLKK